MRDLQGLQVQMSNSAFSQETLPEGQLPVGSLVQWNELRLTCYPVTPAFNFNLV